MLNTFQVNGYGFYAIAETCSPANLCIKLAKLSAMRADSFVGECECVSLFVCLA